MPLHGRFSSVFRRGVIREPGRPETVNATQYRSPADLPKPEQTWALIERQQALRRRGRPAFSIVTVEVGLPPAGPALVLRLMRVFRQRARVGDEIGWLSSDRIAMILPLTDRSGARRFVDQVFSQLGDSVMPRLEVFTE